MFINPLAINTIQNYQHMVQQAQLQLPSLLPPIPSVTPSSATSSIDTSSHHDNTRQDSVDLHSTIDYSQWLQHLYQVWLHQLEHKVQRPFNQKLDVTFTWNPDQTAHKLNDIALIFTGWLWHQTPNQPLWDSVEQITLLWRQTWQSFDQDLHSTVANTGVKEAIRQTGIRFNQLWLESWLHLADLTKEKPSISG